MAQTSDIGVPSVGKGIYTFSEVARLTGGNTQRIRAWFLGWPGRPGPLLEHGVFPPRSSDERQSNYLVSFHSLIDALVVTKLRAFGLKIRYLRKIHDTLVKDLQERHPFSSKDMYTDGKRLFWNYADEHGDEKLRELLTKQHSFPEILKNYLTHVEYDEETLMALRWHISEGIVIDPAKRYGKPIVESCGTPTAILAAGYRANNRDARLVADWYGVSQDDVTCAVSFEDAYLSRVA